MRLFVHILIGSALITAAVFLYAFVDRWYDRSPWENWKWQSPLGLVVFMLSWFVSCGLFFAGVLTGLLGVTP